MTDIVEQAARVAYETYHKAGEFRPYEIAQALADAGLLAEPVRTVPTREEIARITHQQTCERCEDPQERYDYRPSDLYAADAVRALLAGQPTVAEVKAQALEEAADYWENETHQKIVPTWLRERAQQIRSEK